MCLAISTVSTTSSRSDVEAQAIHCLMKTANSLRFINVPALHCNAHLTLDFKAVYYKGPKLLVILVKIIVIFV